jgi:hypothetical protein
MAERLRILQHLPTEGRSTWISSLGRVDCLATANIFNAVSMWNCAFWSMLLIDALFRLHPYIGRNLSQTTKRAACIFTLP